MTNPRQLEKAVALQDPFLNTLRREKIPVSIFLVNGIRLQGLIESYDQYVLVLRNTVNQLIYKHAISTIVPSRLVHLTPNDDGAFASDASQGDAEPASQPDSEEAEGNY